MNGMERSGAIFALQDIAFRYPGTDRQILQNISFDVHAGETVCVLGPSGCGKTTLLKIAASFLRPSRGDVLFRGTPVYTPAPERIVVFQEQDQLFPWKTALQNVAFPLKFVDAGSGHLRSSRITAARRALEEVEMADAADRYPHQLSGGMRQRVALARAFVIEPPLLLLDEPFAAVDAPTRERLGALLLRLSRRHKPGVIFVTHDVEEALRLGDRLIVLGRDGTIRLRESNRPALEPSSRPGTRSASQSAPRAGSQPSPHPPTAGTVIDQGLGQRVRSVLDE